MPKHAAHATLERERTRSRIGDDVGPVPPAALEECFVVLPLADDDFEMLDIVGGVSSADELGLTDADLIEVGRTAAMQAAQELAAAKKAAREEKPAGKAKAKPKPKPKPARAKPARARPARAKPSTKRASAELPLWKRHKLADAVAAATATATRASKGLNASRLDWTSRLDWMAQWLKQSDEEKVHWHSWFEAEMVGGLGYSPSWVSRSG